MPKTIPGDEQHILASMGIYVFTARFLFEQLCLDATRNHSSHDSARTSCRAWYRRIVSGHSRSGTRIASADAYWRDVGTLDAYFEANMDLVSVDPDLNMYDQRWPIRTYLPNLPPPKFVFAEDGEDARPRPGARYDHLRGFDRLGGERCAVDHRHELPHQQLCADRRFDPLRRRGYRAARQGAPRDHRQGGAHSPGVEIGYDHEHDRARGFTVSEGGVIVIAKADGIEHFVEAEQIVS